MGKEGCCYSSWEIALVLEPRGPVSSSWTKIELDLNSDSCHFLAISLEHWDTATSLISTQSSQELNLENRQFKIAARSNNGIDNTAHTTTTSNQLNHWYDITLKSWAVNYTKHNTIHNIPEKIVGLLLSNFLIILKSTLLQAFALLSLISWSEEQTYQSSNTWQLDITSLTGPQNAQTVCTWCH